MLARRPGRRSQGYFGGVGSDTARRSVPGPCLKLLTSHSYKVIALDAGHVCQNLYLACEAIGAGTCATAAYSQELADELVGADGSEEFTVYFAPVGRVGNAEGMFKYFSSSAVYLNNIKFRGYSMKKVILAVMCAVFVFGTLATGYAEQGDWRGGIRSRIQEARQKIDRGIERGTLTRQEAGRLNEELGVILNKIDRMKANGYLSQEERDRINSDLDRLDRDIAREKRDSNVAPGSVTPAPVVQGDWRGGIRSRIQEARQRIDRGIERGSLDRHEARRLNKELH